MISTVKQNLAHQFLADARPWVVTFSGGKDSTFLLVLVIEMLLEFKKNNTPVKKVIVLSSDTKVEMPLAQGYLHTKLKAIKEYVVKEGLNVEVELLTPSIENDFFVCMLGKGYPSPNLQFRWCTQRLKIDPTTRYLTSLVDKYQSVILLLGVRVNESTARADSINSRETNISGLNIHESIPNAYCYSPISEIQTETLWEYLSQNDCEAPWGDHKDMMNLYDKGSGEADCNIALNPYSASCGKTRLGCWVCTVVEKDSSMEGMLKNPEYQWMQPFNDFRNKINKYRYDHTTRRNKSKTGFNNPGAFFLDIRKELLIDLFELEKKVNGHMVEVTANGKILSDEQILAINEEHKKDGDFSNDVLKIANQYGRNFAISQNAFDESYNAIFQDIDIDKNFFYEVLNLNSQYRHSLRRLGVATAQKQLVNKYAQGVAHADQ